METYYSPEGNAEVWAARPPGYMPEADYLALNPPPQLSFEDLLQNKLKKVQMARRQKQYGGFDVEGTKYDSDTVAQLAYTKLEAHLKENPAYTVRWKASDGVWVDMDATLFAKVTTAEKAHIALCFAWQEAKEIELKGCGTPAELDNVSILFGE
ncbi:DUF4376 domain-containing protein [Desulfosediminicola sp.]|uniref:DUF4376 domain-containing protein n=1 Tax=Desulfosediminicola sp. TaxID=2886825 RepID=UPI003AF2ABB0